MNELRAVELVLALLAIVAAGNIWKLDRRASQLEQSTRNQSDLIRSQGQELYDLFGSLGDFETRAKHQDKYARKTWLSIARLTKRINELEGKAE